MTSSVVFLICPTGTFVANKNFRVWTENLIYIFRCLH